MRAAHAAMLQRKTSLRKAGHYREAGRYAAIFWPMAAKYYFQKLYMAA
jgi:hypothetical protein